MTDPRMTPTNDAPVTVEQVDREAAAEYGMKVLRWNRDVVDATEFGGADDDALVQAFARHRLAALASAPAERVATGIDGSRSVYVRNADGSWPAVPTRIEPASAPAGEDFGKWHMMLVRLINAVHRDNGEKTQAIGINAAFEQALEIVGAPRTPPVPTAAEAKPPSPPGYSLADMKRWHHLGHDDDGIPCD